MSVSKPTTDTRQVTQSASSSRNLNIEGNEGITIGETSGPITLTQSDANAIAAGESIALESLGVVSDIYSDSLDFSSASFSSAGSLVTDALDLVSGIAGDATNAVIRGSAAALDAVGDSAENSLQFAATNVTRGFDFASRESERASDSVADAVSRGYTFAGDESERASDFARGVFDSSLRAVSDTVNRSQATLGSTVTALNTVAKEQSTSSDQRVQEIAKYAIYAAAAIGLGVTLVIAFKGRG